MKNIYLDNSATTRLDEDVLSCMLPYLKEEYGNASAVYKLGRKARSAIEEAREKIAKELNCDASEIYFTSGGTESDNTALRGIAHRYSEKGKHIITSKIEHPAILETCKDLEKEGFTVSYIGVDENGIIDLEELEKAITKDTILISVMFANNEIGTIEPIQKIGEIAKAHSIYFHTDAVQAIGSSRIDVQKLNIDLLSMSSHKFYGPKGIGALYVRKGIHFKNVLTGGHQEKNKRPGTENVPAIVGMGRAIELAYSNLDEHVNHIKSLRDYLYNEIKSKLPDVIINGDMENRLPGNLNMSFKEIRGETLLVNLDMKGIYASIGSACTSGSLDASHVLLAIGVKEEIAKGSLRISIGKYNTKEEIDYLIESLVEIITRLRKI